MSNLLPVEVIVKKIHLIRDEKVMLDYDEYRKLLKHAKSIKSNIASKTADPKPALQNNIKGMFSHLKLDLTSEDFKKLRKDVWSGLGKRVL